ERNVLALGLLIDPDRVSLAEGAAARILARQAHPEAFRNEAAERQRFRRGPIEPLAILAHGALGIDDAGQRLVDGQVFGNRGERATETVEQLAVDRRFHVTTRRFRIGRLVQAAPATGEPVGLVRLVALAGFEFAFQQRFEFVAQVWRGLLVDHAFSDQLAGIDLAHPRVLADLGVHQRLREAGLVTFVVTEAAVAPHVDHDIAAELLAILDRQLARPGYRFRIIAVDVQDRGLNALGHVGRVG